MNVILLISDTVRSDYLGCYGSPWVQTPNLDALARESAVMTRFYTGSFPTGPMRKDTHSGRWTFPYANWQAPRPTEEVLLAETIARRGYRTAYIGDTNNSQQYLFGFDHKEIVTRQSSRFEETPEKVKLPADARKLRYPENYITRIVRNAMGWAGEEDRSAPRTMRAAHRWLEEHRADKKPFFLWIDTFDPHEPWDEPRYYIDLYDPGYKGDELIEPAYEPSAYASKREIEHMRCMYAGKLTMVDRWIGWLLDGIENMGLKDNTALIMTSDHGFYHGEHGLIGKMQLRREGGVCKRWPLYATIAHPPLLLRIPGLKKGKRFDTFCQPADLMPTILDLARVPIPRRVQGESLLPVLRGEKKRLRDFAVSGTNYVQDEEVRSPTCYRTKDWLYVYGGDEWRSELYDLKNDPDEKRNVLKQRLSVARDLHQRYLEFLESVDCPPKSLALRREFNPQPRPDTLERKLL
ncbi:MAG: sulfatase [Candidatus Sumerlaeota bacterium]|nr:sulfatase [Candidatus Sumerlaeota bacterium]